MFDKGIGELSRLIETKQSSSVEITGAFLKRIEKLDERIHAFITVDPDKVMEAARKSDERRAAGKSLSAYDGIPVAVKDNITINGTLTTCGSRILENFVAPYDATSWEKLSAMGFINIGKTNMDEFAMGSTTEGSCFGPTRNPFDTERVPGGSSGGSAAAVAARMAPAALGSDTGGSIRQPASFCGVTGIKPTYGRVSRYGLVAFASSLDQIGTFARNVDDAALLLSFICGHDPRDSTSVDQAVDFCQVAHDVDIKGMRLGLPDEYFQGLDDDVKNLVEKEISRLEGMGASVERISLRYTEYAIPVYYLIATAEASSNLARFDGVRYGRRSKDSTDLLSLYNNSRSQGFGTEVKRRIILGTYALSSGYYDAYYLKALKGRRLIIDDFRAAFEKVDAIVTPTVPMTAFKIGEMVSDPLSMYMSDILTTSANLAGIPGISVPVGTDSKGLPVGLQIMGNHFDEKTILRVARAVEAGCEQKVANI